MGVIDSVRSFRTPRPTLPPTMVGIPPGTFTQGYTKTPIPSNLSDAAKLFPDGDYDEQPYHNVTISKEFYVSAFEVTNAMFEEFRPSHREFRNTLNFSKHDDDAVLFVSWYDANQFCNWLTTKYGKTEGLRYRLLTESEWEYSARGGTNTLFWTGDSIPIEMQNHNDRNSGMPKPGDYTPTKVGRFPPNQFGLYDTLGNVEEWVQDWYHEYSSDHQPDVGRDWTTGQLKVTRGGSHGTELYYLRSANRQAAVPSEKNWFIGFRVAADKYSEPTRHDNHQGHNTHELFPVGSKKQVSNNTASASWPVHAVGSAHIPILRSYVNIPMPAGKKRLPFSVHNHDPTIAACRAYDVQQKKVVNKGLIASWFSTNCGEAGRCTGLAYSRLLPNADAWTSAMVDLNLADRTQCCPAYYYDRESYRLYQFSAACAAGDWSGFYSDLEGLLRYSDDCGETWSDIKIIWPKHGIEHQLVVTIIKSQLNNRLLVPVDHWGKPPYVEIGDQTLVQHNNFTNSADLFNSSKWYRNASNGGAYNDTGGHHSSIVELRNGSFLSVGRGHPQDCDLHTKDGCMPISASHDGGFTWIGPAPSIFPAIHGGQREIMIRLGSLDQAIMLCSFANSPMSITCEDNSDQNTMQIVGLFCSVSVDDGDSWTNTKSITTDFSLDGHEVVGFDGEKFKMSYNSAEPNGYMDATIDDAGKIHLITSKNHYEFNFKYLMEVPSCNPT